MFRVLVVLTLLSISLGLKLNSAEIHREWEQFKVTHGKSYSSGAEEAQRRNIFARNLNQILEHNERADRGLESYHKGVNKFSDMEFSEFSELYLGTKGNSRRTPPFLHNPDYKSDLPQSIDWREKGLVTPVKDQGPCGSCWAFAAVAGLEGAHAQKTGKLVSLSEQNILDCSESYGNYGCRGGFIDNAFEYIIDNGGLDTEASYPYEALVGDCWFTFTAVGANMTSYVGIPQDDENALLSAVARGPVSIGIDAEDDFVAYSKGIFSSSTCDTTDINHGVAIVGYGSENGTDYYIVKNSWGASWGENGYIRMARGKNLCGVANMAYYPLV